MPLPGTLRLNRRWIVVASVLGLHVLGIWALQSGLVRRAAETLIPVHVLAELIEAPRPAPEVLTPPAPTPPRNVQATPKPPRPPERTEAPPLAVAPSGVTATQAPVTASPAPVSEPLPAQASTVPIAAPTPPALAPQVELPSSNAEYLNNPRPAYPPLSKRLGEQGKVIVRVFIDTTGMATQAEIRRSSGYERLDQTALQTVMRWRYVPGKRNGVPEAMWFNIPIDFVLD
jgi:protein TonB